MSWESADPHYAQSLDAYREALELGIDRRLLSLYLLGQWSCLGEEDQVEGVVRDAVAEGTASVTEMMEVVVQSGIYVGQGPQSRVALRLLDVIAQLGLEEELVATRLPPESRRATADREAEMNEWGNVPSDFDSAVLMERYGWEAISLGLWQTPRQHPTWVTYLDQLSPDFLQAWLNYVFVEMYRRDVLDLKTRLVTMIGNTVAVGDLTQARNHMTSALRNGLGQDTIFGLLFRSTISVGMPKALHAVKLFSSVIEDGEGSQGS